MNCSISNMIIWVITKHINQIIIFSSVIIPHSIGACIEVYRTMVTTIDAVEYDTMKADCKWTVQQLFRLNAQQVTRLFHLPLSGIAVILQMIFIWNAIPFCATSQLEANEIWFAPGDSLILLLLCVCECVCVWGCVCACVWVWVCECECVSTGDQGCSLPIETSLLHLNGSLLIYEECRGLIVLSPSPLFTYTHNIHRINTHTHTHTCVY